MARAAKPPALRWERRPEARPSELLEAALRVFAAHGYHKTRLDEVAAAAGVTKGALYHYFTNKEELLLRALEQYQARSFGRVEDALRTERGSSSARLRVAVHALFGGDHPARRDVLTLLQNVSHEVPQVYRRWLASGPMHAWRIIARLIEEGQRAGEFRPDADADVAARVLVTGLVGQVMWQQVASDVPGLAIAHDRLIDAAVELLLASVSLPPSRPRSRALASRS